MCNRWKHLIVGALVTAGVWVPNTMGAQKVEGPYGLKFTGYIQADGQYYFGDEDALLDNQFLLRRARIGVEGTAYKGVDFKIVPDFGGAAPSLQDAYININYGLPFQLRVGRFKVPFGLERLQSSHQTLFIEPSQATSLTPSYDVGLQVQGNLSNDAGNYAFGVFNGVADGASSLGDTEDEKDVAARLWLLPYKDLGLGFAVTHGKTTNNNRTRWSPQATWYSGRSGFLGEYVVSKGGDPGVFLPLTQRAWQIQMSYTLTGEKASYEGLKPLKPFDPAKHSWGAWELAGRYSELKDDERARTWSGGVNWYLNNALKGQINYGYIQILGSLSDSNMHELLTRVQITF